MKRRMGIKYLTTKEAALMMGVSPSTLRTWGETGRFKAERDPKNNYRIYKIPEIEFFIRNNNLKSPTNKRLLDEDK